MGRREKFRLGSALSAPGEGLRTAVGNPCWLSLYGLRLPHAHSTFQAPQPKFITGSSGKKYGGGCAASGRMSFLRHRRSFRPMWKKQTGSELGAHSRLSSARISRSRLFLSGPVSTGARLCFTGCAQNAVQWSCRSTILQRTLQRTANSVLFACLSRGVHPIDRRASMAARSW